MSKQQPISIDQDSFEDLINGRTGNPIADEEIPELLRKAIQSGRVVLLDGPDARATFKLQIGTDGKFQYVPLA